MLSTTGKDTYLSVEEVIMRAREVYNGGVTELHIVGSHHSELNVEHFGDMFGIKREMPDVV